MDRSIIERHLALAKTHVTDGKRLVLRQRTLLSALERKGSRTTVATQLLRELEVAQDGHMAEVKRLAAALVKAGRA
jgi:hypothetical protein